MKEHKRMKIKKKSKAIPNPTEEVENHTRKEIKISNKE